MSSIKVLRRDKKKSKFKMKKLGVNLVLLTLILSSSVTVVLADTNDENQESKNLKCDPHDPNLFQCADGQKCIPKSKFCDVSPDW